MADTFLGAIRDYLPPELHTRAADDLALIRAFIAPANRGGSRKGLREELVREGSTKGAAEAQVRRWINIGTGRQQRGASGFAKGKRGEVTRARVQNALLRRARVPVVVHFAGKIKFSKKWSKTDKFTAPTRPPGISLEELQDILKLAAAVEKEDGAREAEIVARNVLVGFWMGAPSDDAQLKEEYGVMLPYGQDIEMWGDDKNADLGPDDARVEFTIEQAEGGA